MSNYFCLQTQQIPYPSAHDPMFSPPRSLHSLAVQQVPFLEPLPTQTVLGKDTTLNKATAITKKDERIKDTTTLNNIKHQNNRGVTGKNLIPSPSSLQSSVTYVSQFIMSGSKENGPSGTTIPNPWWNCPCRDRAVLQYPIIIFSFFINFRKFLQFK